MVKCLEQNRLYQSRNGTSIPGIYTFHFHAFIIPHLYFLHSDELRLFCHEDVLDTLTQENVIHLSQLKNEFADDVIEVDTKRLWDFFSEEAQKAIEGKGAYYTNMQYHD